ncbi:MAG: hypothetical protein U0795_12675 [Pirellulales bacterium]
MSGPGRLPERLPSADQWWQAVGSLSVCLLVSGVAGIVVAYAVSDAWRAQAALLGWFLVVAGTALSWVVTWWFAGPWLGLLHITAGFICRALMPLGIAAGLAETSPQWQAAGLLWWTFGFYLVGLAADTWVALRLVSEPAGRVIRPRDK